MHSDILSVLQEILLTLVEIKVAIHKFDAPAVQQEEWLTAQQAMEFLYMEKRTFYRRKREEQGEVDNEKGGKEVTLFEIFFVLRIQIFFTIKYSN